MKELKTTAGKVRLLNDAKVEDVDLWLRSSPVRVSRTQLLNALFDAFHAEIVGKECNLETIATSIATGVKIGKEAMDRKRFGK